MSDDLKRLQGLIASMGADALLQQWMAATRRRCFRTESTSDRFAALQQRCRGFMDTLVTAVEGATTLGPGSSELREPIQQLSFIAGWMVGIELPIGVGVALGQALGEVLGIAESSIGEGLTLTLAEAYAVGVRDQAAAQHRRIIEQSQVVCALREDVAALFLVGDPKREALVDAVGRLLMLSLMRDARYVLIDASGLVTVEPSLAEVLELLSRHRDGLGDRELLLTGPLPSSALPDDEQSPATYFEDVSAALDARPCGEAPEARHSK